MACPVGYSSATICLTCKKMVEDKTDLTIEVEVCLHDDSIQFMLNERIFTGRP